MCQHALKCRQEEIVFCSAANSPRWLSLNSDPLSTASTPLNLRTKADAINDGSMFQQFDSLNEQKHK